MTERRHVLYVAASHAVATTSAARLERSTDGHKVEGVADIETIREHAPAADCVVFAETPTSAAGAQFLDVLEACGETPLVLCSDERYSPAAARATDGIDGYVRRSDGEQMDHLADEIEWVCRGRSADETRRADRPADSSTVEPSNVSHSKIARLHEMATRIVACRDESQLFELAIEAADGILEFDSSSIMIRERRDDGIWLVSEVVSRSGPECSTVELRIDEGVAGKTFREGRSLCVDDMDSEPVSKPGHPSYRSGISVPIGEYGVFQATSTEKGCYKETDLELAELLCAHVEETLGRLRIEERLRARRERLTKLHEGAARIAGADDEATIYELAVEASETILAFDSCVILVARDETFVPGAYSVSLSGPYVHPLSIDYGIAGETYRTGDSFLIDDLHGHPFSGAEEGHYRSVISVPLGEYGVYQTVSEQPAAFDEEDLEHAELLGSHVTEAVARARAEDQLASEHYRLSALFDNVPDPAVRYKVVDGEPIVRDVNDSFEDVFGYDRSTIVGEHIDDYVLPPGFEEEARELNESLSLGETLQIVSRRRTVEEVRDFLINVVPVTVGERSVEGFSIYTDITEQKVRERELTAQNERLDEFASIVSHDLRNPLNIARGYLELAQETGDCEHFEEIEVAHERMSELIDTLLTVARRGDVIAGTEPVAVHDIAKRAWSAVDTDNATLAFERDGILDADKARLVEAFENLLRNAVEHGLDDAPTGAAGDRPPTGTDGGNALTITVGCTDRGFFVADDGIGIPEDERETVLESGYTTAPNSTGYGLSIVKQIADAHGWTLLVTESVDGGARFEFDGALGDTDSPESIDRKSGL